MSSVAVPENLFALRVRLPSLIEWAGVRISRAEVLDRAWADLRGLAGIDEGMVLSEEAHTLGLETESWTVDSGEAPRERDWVGGQKSAVVAFYFEKRVDAEAAHAWAVQRAPSLVAEGAVFPVEVIPPQDWNAQWKAAFRELAEGIPIPPFWRVVPAWDGADVRALAPGGGGNAAVRLIGINPGAGFGTGTHETTQLCLQALGESEANVSGAHVLDFGSGSGILAIGAALLGAQVDAVEIDELAVSNARENAAINSVGNRITYAQDLSELPARTYPVILANILRPVLLQFCDALMARWDGAGTGSRVILSGLVEGDLPSVIAAYSAKTRREPRVLRSGDWRALVF